MQLIKLCGLFTKFFFSNNQVEMKDFSNEKLNQSLENSKNTSQTLNNTSNVATSQKFATVLIDGSNTLQFQLKPDLNALSKS